MKKVSLLIFVSLILLLAFASCTLGQTTDEECAHEWKEATCTVAKTCTKCNATEGEAAGHDWADATCTAPKTCKTCNATEGAPKGHLNDVTLDAVPATCTATGKTAGVKCSACGTVTTPQTPTDKLPHNNDVTLDAVPATCTETGLTAGKACSVCETVTVTQEVIPALGHANDITLDAVPATCTTTGLTEGKKCSVCNTVTQPQVDIPVHTPTIVEDPAVPATCTTDGKTKGSHCSECGHVIVAQTTVTAYGHDPMDAEEENRVEPSCTAPGGYDTVVRCYDCNEIITSVHTDLPQLEHKFENYVSDGDATCTADGHKTSSCKYNCGTKDTITDEGSMLPHKQPDTLVCGESWTCQYGCGHESEPVAHVPAAAKEENRVEPSCTEDGKYDSVVCCSRCGSELSRDVVPLPATGHDMAPATCSAPSTCRVEGCGHTDGTARTNHNVQASYVGGVLKYYCASGCDIEFVAEQKYVADGSKKDFYFADPNGKPTLDNSTGEYVINWDGTNGTKNPNKNNELGAQPMLWIPSNDYKNPTTKIFDNFSCENNAFGVVSFKMKTSMTETWTVSIGKPRNEFDQQWNTSKIDIITITGVAEDASYITLKGGFVDEGAKTFTYDIPVTDGWSDMFEVKVFIHLQDDYSMTLSFYINDVHCGYFVRDLKNPGDNKNTIDHYTVKAVYMNGWTHKANTGLVLDDFFFGYTTESAWYFDECDHNFVKGATTAPTCTEQGYTTYKCSVCGGNKKDDFVPATGHSNVTVPAQASTCKVQGWDEFTYCSSCQEADDVKVLLPLIDCIGGEPTKDYSNGSHASCTEDGRYDEVVCCTMCGEELSRTTKTEAATGHSEETVPGQAATCTAAGLTDGVKCSVCQATLTAQTEIAAKGHTLETIPAVEATCETDGKTAGEKCTVCDYKVEGTVVSKDTVPHTYDDDQDADCNVCGETRDLTCAHEHTEEIPAVPATCTTAGSTAGVKCSDCQAVITAPTTVPATGHTLVTDAAVAATCTEKGKTEGKHCSKCDYVEVEQTEIAALGHTLVTDAAVAATCTTDGKTEGKHCSVCSTVTVEQSVVPALGHKMSAATCDAPSTCSVCGHIEGTALTSHTLTNTVKDGKLTYKCSTCTKEFAIDTQYYTDGSSLNGFSFNDSKTNASYVGDSNAPAQKTDSTGNLYYEFLRDAEYNAARPDIGEGVKATGQATMWIPGYHTGLTSLNGNSDAVAFLSFDLNYAMSNNLTFNLVYGKVPGGDFYTAEDPDAIKDPTLVGKEKPWYSSPLGKIQSSPLNIYSEKVEGSYTHARIYGFGSVEIARFDFQEDEVFTAFGSTGWINIQIGFVFDSANDMITAHYYINGEYKTSLSVENTLYNNTVTSVQLDGTSVPVASGYAFDNFAFGYTNNATWVFDDCDHDYSAATCDTLATCSKCHHVTGDYAHELTPATCLAPAHCTKCGKDVGEKLSHTIALAANGNNVSYKCSACNYTFAIEKGYFADGSAGDYDGIAGSSANPTNFGTAQPNIVDGHYEYKKTSTDPNASQVQVWVPGDGANAVFTDCNVATNSMAVFSMSLNAWVSGNSNHVFGLQFADSIYGNNDKDGNNIRWDHKLWDIQEQFFRVTAVDDQNQVKLMGWANGSGFVTLKTIQVDPENPWTGWFDIMVVVEFDAEKDTITCHYYLDGQYITSGTKALELQDNGINAVYINCNTVATGSGYMFDNLAFGYTKNAHWTFDGNAHNVTEATCSTPATCSCGWTGTTVAAHDVSSAIVDGKLTCSCSGCDTKFVADDTRIYDGTNVTYSFSKGATSDAFTAGPNADGEYQFTVNGDNRSQFMLYIPGSSRTDVNAFNNFSCETASSGIISFKMKTSVQSAQQDFRLILMEARNNNDSWSNGEWNGNSINIMEFGSAANSSVKITGSNIAGELTSIPVVDGWTEWFNVQIIVEMRGDYVLELTYFINGVNYGTYTRDLKNPGANKMTINDGIIESVYFTGWTQGQGTGFMLDDLYIGYAADTHWTLDGHTHVITPSTSCIDPETCSCGWVGTTLAHDYAEATCSAPATCKDCGATTGAKAAHTTDVALVNGKPTHFCTVCDYSVSIENFYYTDGTTYNGFTINGASTQKEFFNSVFYQDDPSKNDGKPYTGNGYYEYVKNETTDASKQLQIWIPQYAAGFTEFNSANNAVGFITFDINANMDKNFTIQLMENASGVADKWSAEGCIKQNIFQIMPKAEKDTSSAKIQIWGKEANAWTDIQLTTDENHYTGWINVFIGIKLDPETDTITAYYYINDVFYGAASREITTKNNGISSLYVNGNTYGEGTGYKLDNFAVGYTKNGHALFDGADHQFPAGATCASGNVTCSCGWTGTLEHSFGDVACSACLICGTLNANAASHSNLKPYYIDGVLKYGCTDCGFYYVPETFKYNDGTNNNNLVDAGTNYDFVYNADGYIEYLNKSEGTQQLQFWAPEQGHPAAFHDFTCANNAIGFLSFKINAYTNDTSDRGVEVKLNSHRNVTGTGYDFWSQLSTAVLKIKPVTDANATTTTIIDSEKNVIYTVTLDENKWTGWLDIAILITLKDNNTIKLDYYINGEHVGTVNKAMPIKTNAVSSVYVSAYSTAEGSGLMLDNFAFGYTLTNKAEYNPNGLFYNSVVEAANVQSETLKTIVAGKIKQCDQSNPGSDPTKDYFAEGGTPVYVLVDGKDGSEVEALYISRSVKWLGTEKAHFTEFRFAINGEAAGPAVTSISFDYKINGTVAKNERFEFTDFDGTKFFADAYVQVKTVSSEADVIENAGDNYPELAGTDLVLDGQWHTFTYEFKTPRKLVDFLINLYQFQGEMVIANIEILYENSTLNPDGTLNVTEIGTRNTSEDNTSNVTDEALLTIVDGKIKQFDQTDAATEGDHSYGYFVKEVGTSHYVTAFKDGEEVQAVYLSRSVDWETYADVSTQNGFKSEFRFAIDNTKRVTSISFDYVLNGTLTGNRQDNALGQLSIFQIKYTNKADNTYNPSDAYFDVVTDTVENEATFIVADSQWHTFTYEFENSVQLDNFLIILSEFQGEILISNLVVTYE